VASVGSSQRGDACDTIPEPIPAVSNRGLVMTMLLLLSAGFVLFRLSHR
jgi:hypothetical protein